MASSFRTTVPTTLGPPETCTTTKFNDTFQHKIIFLDVRKGSERLKHRVASIGSRVCEFVDPKTTLVVVSDGGRSQGLAPVKKSNVPTIVSSRSRKLFQAVSTNKTKDCHLSSNIDKATTLGIPIWNLSRFEKWVKRQETLVLSNKENSAGCVVRKSVLERSHCVAGPVFVVEDLLGLYPTIRYQFPMSRNGNPLSSMLALHRPAPAPLFAPSRESAAEAALLTPKKKGLARTETAGNPAGNETKSVKSPPQEALRKRQKRGGYCENCCLAYTGLLKNHCETELHQKVSRDASRYAELDRLIAELEGKRDPEEVEKESRESQQQQVAAEKKGSGELFKGVRGDVLDENISADCEAGGGAGRGEGRRGGEEGIWGNDHDAVPGNNAGNGCGGQGDGDAGDGGSPKHHASDGDQTIAFCKSPGRVGVGGNGEGDGGGRHLGVRGRNKDTVVAAAEDEKCGVGSIHDSGRGSAPDADATTVGAGLYIGGGGGVDGNSLELSTTPAGGGVSMAPTTLCSLSSLPSSTRSINCATLAGITRVSNGKVGGGTGAAEKAVASILSSPGQAPASGGGDRVATSLDFLEEGSEGGRVDTDEDEIILLL